MSRLFEPLTLRDVTFKNRVFVSPMCQYSATDGVPNDWHLVHLGSRAVGGAGLVVAEATAVSPEGRISPDDTGLWNDAQRDSFARIARFVKAHGAKAGVQLAHAGRKASMSSPWKGNRLVPPSEGGWQVVAPSALAFADGYGHPLALGRAGIDRVIADFVAATRRAIDAGFDVVELHFAHGYLVHEFLSPLSNVRDDDFGGPLENRMRLALAIAREVRAAWGNRPLFARVSASDWVDGGWDLAQSVELAKRLKALGVDLVDCSSGGNVATAKIPVGPGYQVPFAETIRREAGVATGAVGLITEARQAEEIVASGKADAVFLARELLRDPYFPLHAARELGADVAWPVQYERAKPR